MSFWARIQKTVQLGSGSGLPWLFKGQPVSSLVLRLMPTGSIPPALKVWGRQGGSLTTRVIALRRGTLLLVVSAALGAHAGGQSQSPAKTPEAPTTPESRRAVKFERNLVYGKAGGQELRLNLARPTEAAPNRPCIVFVHGGGWTGGDKDIYDEAIRFAAGKGYVGATVEYRLAPAHRFPAQVQDVKCAVRYLRAHAEQYGIDPKRIGAAGDSAGGQLVMMLGVTRPEDGLEGDGGWSGTSSAVQAVVSYYGPTDLGAADVPELSKWVVEAFLGAPAAKVPDVCRKASPIFYVHTGQAPILLLQGTVDPLVPTTQAVRMATAMSAAKAAGRVELIVGAAHGFSGAQQQHAIETTAAFFDEHLRAERITK
jgi:acetyl esterase/lipase